MRKAILKHYPECDVISIPVADGGEGSVDAFLEALGGEKIYLPVTGPYFDQKVEGYYGILPGNIAIVEMAAAAALPMVGDRKNPSLTTTYGVGELILDAAHRGVGRIIVALGGSATNDAACGLASAVGVRFYNNKGERFIPVGDTLDQIEGIDLSAIDPALKNIDFVTMCDIDNPFYGKEGASYVYAPQKGADPKMVEELDMKMQKLASVIKRDLSIDVQSIPGSGAAGGMGGGMVAFFSSSIQMGIETVLEAVHFSSLLDGADFVYTGEGKIDGQSLRGKVVIGVARESKKKNVDVIAFVGDIGDDVENAYSLGVSAIFSINRVALPYQMQKPRAKSDLFHTVDDVLRLQKCIEQR